MNQPINLKTTNLVLKNLIRPAIAGRGFLLLTLALACLALSSSAFAVSPAPDGGYAGDNTAEGDFALQSLISGATNTAVGHGALYSDTTGSGNTVTGYQALFSNISGGANTAIGADALYSNTTGSFNTANGDAALVNNTSANNNTAVGFAALQRNISGHDNTAQGFQAANNAIGSNNVAVGSNAGGNLTTGSNNIDIGANVLGNAGEANTIRIGKQGTQKATFIAGISCVPVTGSTVVVNASGKLGVCSSSARFKQAIKPMDKASEAILALKPVSFRYKSEIDPEGIPQFGLMAE